MKRNGFSMIEMTMVIVIIGVIFTIFIKGKDVYEASKVKSVEGQYNKISTAINTYLTKYRQYPGDGCTSATPAGPSDCTGTINGLLTTANERAAMWDLLINDTNILSTADRNSIFGVDWDVSYIGGEMYLAFGDNGNTESAKTAIVCEVDKSMDDGVNTTGLIRSNGVYDTTTDCWSLTGVDRLQMNLRF